MGQILGKALPFATIMALITALGFTVPLIHDIQYGPFEFDIDIKDIDILDTGVYNFTLKVSITNTNLTAMRLTDTVIGIYTDSNHYTVISQYFIPDLFIPSEATSTYYPEGTITLINDDVPRYLYATIEGKYTVGAIITNINFEIKIDLKPYWP